MEQRYSIYFSGDVLEGHNVAEVRSRLARLFNADEPTLARLFSGRLQVLKRDCDKATAQKYKQAMERAGARPVIKAAQAAATAPPPAKEQRAISAAEKIAALAAAPDLEGYRSDRAEPAPAAAPQRDPSDPDLYPAGAELLRPDERQAATPREVDTSALEISAPVDRLSPEPPPPPAAPDTSHLQMGEVGETIPTLALEDTAPPPGTLDIEVAPVGADFSEFAPPPAQEPELDLSDMDLAPPGSDVLEEKYRQRKEPAVPDTDHLSLED